MCRFARRAGYALALMAAITACVSAQPPVPPPPTRPADAPAPTPPVDARPPLEDIPETPVVAEIGGPGSQGGAAPGNTVVETPTRTGTPLSQVGSSVSVVTAADIEQRKQYSVLEVLRGLPGVDVVQSGGPGRVATVFIRGANSDQTKVLLDGIWMNDPITTGRLFDFSNLSVDNIERIEVIRGPQSVLYGSDAIGGVINIITKKGQGPRQTRAGAYGGAFQTSRESGNLSGGNERVYYSWGASYLDTKSFSAADRRLPGNTERDAYQLGTLAGRMGWTPFENFDVDYVMRYVDAGTNIDVGGGPNQDDPNRKNYTNQYFTRAQIRYATPGGFWEQKLAYNLTNQTRRQVDDVDPMHPFDSSLGRFHSQMQLVDWQHNFQLHETNTLTVGMQYLQEDGQSFFNSNSIFGPFNIVSPNVALRDPAIYAQEQIRIADRWFTTFGARQDHYSQAGTADTYRVTSLYRVPLTNTGFRGSIGTGFKAPTIFQLFDAFSGNPNLRPEESKGWDYGLEQPLLDGRVVLAATYFRNDFANLIDFNPATFAYFNIGAAVATGAELSGTFHMRPDTTLTLTYTRLDARDRGTDLALLRRPRDKIGVIFNRQLLGGRANFNYTMFYVGNRVDQDFTQFPSPRVTVPNYIVANVAASYDVTRRLQVFGRVDNFFNARYQEVFGFGTAPISAYGGAQVLW